MINHVQHIALLQKELLFIQAKWDKILQQSAASMLQKGELYVSKYMGYDSARGNVLVKFNNKVCLPPRRNERLVGFIPSVEKQNFKKWNSLTYEGLYIEGRYFSFETQSLFYEYGEDYTIVGFSGILEQDVSKLVPNILIYFGPPEEPIEYIANLLNFIQETSPNSEDILALKITDKQWNPEPLLVDENIVVRIQTDLIENDIVIIQGPPGTGKTFLMAQLCSALLRLDYKILVTALTNRALIELAQKSHLKTAMLEGKIYKTSLSADESKSQKLRGLKAFKNLKEQRPPFLLSTYYVMSQIAAEAMKDVFFDFIIIEEASQAFLSTIAMARKLGKKCIVIGDIKQLEPIFHKTYSSDDPNHFHWMICGLKAISFYLSKSKQYILTDSYRLTQDSVNATNAFYEGKLRSKSSAKLPLEFSNFSLLEKYFLKNGGTSMRTMELPDGKLPSIECISFIVDVIKQLKKFIEANSSEDESETTKISILTYNRVTVRYLQTEIYPKIEKPDEILIDTIDKVQGLTTEFCIFFIPTEAIPGSLQENRFNVTTSRAKLCTLIIAGGSISNFLTISPGILNYFKNVITVET